VWKRLSIRWEGFLARTLDMAFLEYGAQSTKTLRAAYADLSASILFTIRSENLVNEFRRQGVPMIPRGGLAGMLGPFAHNRVRDCLALTLHAELSYTSMDLKEHFFVYKNISNNKFLGRLVRYVSVSTVESISIIRRGCDIHGCVCVDINPAPGAKYGAS
jgi:hypothetical protein